MLSRGFGKEAIMAASRDQTVRVVRNEEPIDAPDPAPVEARQPTPAADPVDRRTGDAPVADAATPAQAAPATPRKRKIIPLGIGALLLLAAATYGGYYYMIGRFFVGTDDAYVKANNSTLGARVSGHIAAIGPGDNTNVKAGDILFRIDDGDYRIAVESAEAKIGTQQATIDRIGRQVTAQQSAVEQAKAQLASADAASTRAQLDFDRQQALSSRGFASRAVFETSQATRDQSTASVQSAKAALDAASDNVEVTKAQQAEARAQLKELQAALEKAQRDLAFTEVRAPVDGIFANRMVSVGDYISAGQRLASVVPLDGVYIDANFKETQLRRLKPGQSVAISVDAYSNRDIRGVVESLAPAAGSVFTLLPPDNATGNFTKIVQRVPVRIRVPADVAKENNIRAGMSVYVKVNTKADVKE